MNKRLNNETTADDLLMLPDIDGIVKDIKGQKTVSGQSKAGEKLQSQKRLLLIRTIRHLLEVEAAGRCSSNAVRPMTIG